MTSNEVTWEEYLVGEHELIERAMAVLKRCLDTIRASAVEPTTMRRALDFLLEFGDGLHNAKEERSLFPRMAERGIPVEGGPLGVMLAEHEAERELLAGMLAQLDSLAQAEDDDLEAFRAKGMQYLKVRAEHIWKENDVLYVMGRRALTREDGRELVEAFHQLDVETYGSDARDKYTQMVVEAEGLRGRGRLVDNLSRDQLHAILETLPVEVTFVDAHDVVAYFNRLDKKKIFTRTRSAIGRRVSKCHPEKSVGQVERIVSGFRDGSLDKAEFWIDFKGDKVLIRYYPVFGDQGDYLGVLEVTQEIGELQRISGQKRLLD